MSTGKTPVALIFLRRSCVMQVLTEIRAYAPDKLFLISDGGRTPEEHDECLRLRILVEAAIDWPCAIQTRYSDVNLGCRKNIPAGLDCVFAQVENAIILEDDCVPTPDFFSFCQEMLEHYADDENIWGVSGSNHLDSQTYFGTDSYLFYGYTITWGWATWRRAWRHFDVDMKKWPQARTSGLLKSMFLSAQEELFWDRTFESVWSRTCECDPWDYQWTFAVWLDKGLFLMPRANLVSNVGVGPLATHNKDASSYFNGRQTARLAVPLQHPVSAVRNDIYDRDLGKLVYYRDNHAFVPRVRMRLLSALPLRCRSVLWRLSYRLRRLLAYIHPNRA